MSCIGGIIGKDCAAQNQAKTDLQNAQTNALNALNQPQTQGSSTLLIVAIVIVVIMMTVGVWLLVRRKKS